MPSSTRRLEPRKTPRQRRSHETRGRILAAAARVFADRGYAGGTTNHIAAEAGVSVGSLYQYFPNKDALLVELMRAHIAEGATLLARRLAEVGDDATLEVRLRAAVDAVVDNHRVEPRLHQVLFEEAPRPESVLAELHGLEDAAVAAVAGLLRDESDVAVTDAELAAWFVVATIESLTHRYVGSHARGRLDLDAFADELARLVVSYLRTGPGGPG